jgi:putative effector of murein hydrolase
VTVLIAVIEFLVGAACAALALPMWSRGTTLFRAVAVALLVAGLAAMINAIVTVV